MLDEAGVEMRDTRSEAQAETITSTALERSSI